MKADGLKYFTDLGWTSFGLVLFVMAFVFLVGLIVKQYQNETLKKVENLPFEGEGQ